jgi:hypothetical protein
VPLLRASSRSPHLASRQAFNQSAGGLKLPVTIHLTSITRHFDPTIGLISMGRLCIKLGGALLLAGASGTRGVSLEFRDER